MAHAHVCDVRVVGGGEAPRDAEHRQEPVPRDRRHARIAGAHTRVFCAGVRKAQRKCERTPTCSDPVGGLTSTRSSARTCRTWHSETSTRRADPGSRLLTDGPSTGRRRENGSKRGENKGEKETEKDNGWIGPAATSAERLEEVPDSCRRTSTSGIARARRRHSRATRIGLVDFIRPGDYGVTRRHRYIHCSLYHGPKKRMVGTFLHGSQSAVISDKGRRGETDRRSVKPDRILRTHLESSYK